MEALWRAVEDEVAEHVPSDRSIVLTKAVLVVEFIDASGRRDTLKVATDRALKRLTTNDIAGLLVTALTQVLAEVETNDR